MNVLLPACYVASPPDNYSRNVCVCCRASVKSLVLIRH